MKTEPTTITVEAILDYAENYILEAEAYEIDPGEFPAVLRSGTGKKCMRIALKATPLLKVVWDVRRSLNINEAKRYDDLKRRLMGLPIVQYFQQAEVPIRPADFEL